MCQGSPSVSPEQHLCVRPTAPRLSEARGEGQEEVDSEARVLTWGDLQVTPYLPAQLWGCRALGSDSALGEGAWC